MTSDAIWAWLKQVLAVGGPSVVVAYGLFQWLGTKWLENRFAASLETLKHTHQKELEEVRHKIQSMFSRISKIHEREFEVLPKAWFMLHDAYGAAYNVVSFLRYEQSLDEMPKERFEEFLKDSRLTPSQQNELREAPDRQAYYRDALAGVQFDEAQEKRRLFNNYLIENRIFMTKELHTKFSHVSKILAQGLTSFEIGKQAKDYAMQREGTKSITTLQPSIDEAEQAVQDRLHFGDA
jgi:hypothetical protein